MSLLPNSTEAGPGAPYWATVGSGGGGGSGPNLSVSTITFNPTGGITMANASGPETAEITGYVDLNNTSSTTLGISFISGKPADADGMWGIVDSQGGSQFYGDFAAGRYVVCGLNAGTSDPLPFLTTNGGSDLVVSASNVNISSLNVSSINGAAPGGGSVANLVASTLTLGVPGNLKAVFSTSATGTEDFAFSVGLSTVSGLANSTQLSLVSGLNRRNQLSLVALSNGTKLGEFNMLQDLAGQKMQMIQVVGGGGPAAGINRVDMGEVLDGPITNGIGLTGQSTIVLKTFDPAGYTSISTLQVSSIEASEITANNLILTAGSKLSTVTFSSITAGGGNSISLAQLLSSVSGGTI